MLTFVVWLPLILLMWIYMGYPITVALIRRLRPLVLVQDTVVPTLSVAMAVHDGVDQVEARIADVLAQASRDVMIIEVLIGSDGSGDGTDERVLALSRTDPRIRLRSLSRRGQTATQHDLIELATGDVVVLTDVETRFTPGCLDELSKAFRDKRVGCATGRLEWRAESATATSRNEGLYWRYERAVRRMESDAGLLTAVTGAILAIRRTHYRPVPPTASMDHLLPLYVCEQGANVVFIPTARATDRPISGLREQFANRRRTASRGIIANASMARRLAPWRFPGVALAMWSHKLLRWATPWLLAITALGGVGLGIAGQPAYLVIPGLVLVGLVAAATAHVIVGTGRRPPAPLAFARAFVVVNAAFGAAWIDVARGRRIQSWRPVDGKLEN